MKISHEDIDQISVVGIKGEFTADQAESFRTLVQARLNANQRDFVLNLTEMGLIDSKGLEAVLWLQDQCVERLGQIRLAAARENVRKILELTRLSGQLECLGDVDAAIKSLR